MLRAELQSWHWLMPMGCEGLASFISMHSSEPYRFVHTNYLCAQGGALVAPVLGFWYGKLNVLIPAKTTVGALQRLFLDQAIFAPIFVSNFLSALLLLNGAPELIVPKLKQDLFSTVTANWTLWIPGQFVNFKFIPSQFNLLFSNVLALIWSTYLSFAGSRKVRDK
jgi:protein Mpv17